MIPEEDWHYTKTTFNAEAEKIVSTEDYFPTVP